MNDKKQRKVRNFLLDQRFQLKYTGMVLVVTVAVAGGLGYVAYQYSTAQTQALTAEMAANPNLDPDVAADLEGFAKEEDRKVMAAIIVGVAILALAMGITGIIVTHRVVGPAYRMSRLFEEVGGGKLRVSTGIRKGDELQDLFSSFGKMVESLRDKRGADIAALEDTLQKMESAGMESEYITELRELLERIRTDVS